jgi:hypothetical protein
MFTAEINIRPLANSRQTEPDPRWMMQIGEVAAAAAAYRDMAAAMPRCCSGSAWSSTCWATSTMRSAASPLRPGLSIAHDGRDRVRV